VLNATIIHQQQQLQTTAMEPNQQSMPPCGLGLVQSNASCGGLDGFGPSPGASSRAMCSKASCGGAYPHVGIGKKSALVQGMQAVQNETKSAQELKNGAMANNDIKAEQQILDNKWPSNAITPNCRPESEMHPVLNVTSKIPGLPTITPLAKTSGSRKKFHALSQFGSRLKRLLNPKRLFGRSSKAEIITPPIQNGMQTVQNQETPFDSALNLINGRASFKTPESFTSLTPTTKPVLRKITSGMDNPSAFTSCSDDEDKALGGKRGLTLNPKKTTAQIELSLKLLGEMANVFLSQSLSHHSDGCIGREGRQLSNQPCIPGLTPHVSGSTDANPLGLNWWPGDEMGKDIPHGEGEGMGCVPDGRPKQNKSITGSNPSTLQPKLPKIKAITFTQNYFRVGPSSVAQSPKT
jgi:hypothetical protein